MEYENKELYNRFKDIIKIQARQQGESLSIIEYVDRLEDNYKGFFPDTVQERTQKSICALMFPCAEYREHEKRAK